MSNGANDLRTPEARPAVVDRSTWATEITKLVEREKRHTREGDAIAAARRRLPMTTVGPVTVVGEDGPVPFVDVFEGRRILIAYTFMWNRGRPFTEQCMGCTFSMSQLPNQTYFSQRDVTVAVLSEGPWQEIEDYRKHMGWTHPWYSTSTCLDNPAVAGEQFLRSYLRIESDVYVTYQSTARGTEVMDPVLGLLDRTVLGRQETWEDSPLGWPQTRAGQWWLRDGRPAAQWERQQR
ncbi:DUF899 family protein [Brevibacterium antiquum]|uniref:Predicted dithiol-disulfide oxidoreductase, DUF899 family n=1 Tax=Brevibacterium antiquum TaxID=234835 RepID=A0A2H1K8D2_9MICO|nr:DUF899 family protein [Brevibacterium antiquum]SMX95818.1 Predicted dithiol-disulfide oxidoreductase, DUF899 family [Brevibacterium antiquum]